MQPGVGMIDEPLLRLGARLLAVRATLGALIAFVASKDSDPPGVLAEISTMLQATADLLAREIEASGHGDIVALEVTKTIDGIVTSAEQSLVRGR